jgi:hypothetical protein
MASSPVANDRDSMGFCQYALAIVVASVLTAPILPALAASDSTAKDIDWQLSCNEPLSGDRRTTCIAEIDFFGTPMSPGPSRVFVTY